MRQPVLESLHALGYVADNHQNKNIKFGSFDPAGHAGTVSAGLEAAPAEVQTCTASHPFGRQPCASHDLNLPAKRLQAIMS